MTEIDPALSQNLAELAAMAREIGADQVILLRNTTGATLSTQVGDLDRRANSEMIISIQAALPLPDAGTLVVILFPAGDGGQAPLEAL